MSSAEEDPMIGIVVSEITVVSYSHSNNGRVYLCNCSCGKTCLLKVSKINEARKHGKVLACGCRKGRDGIHHHSKHPLFNRYCSMVSRCTNLKSTSYPNYGGRGITVCSRWLEPCGQGFTNFVSDMGECPPNFSIERLDVNGPYSPENCVWADSTTQTVNRRPFRSLALPGVTYDSKSSGWKASFSRYKTIYYVGFSKDFFEICCMLKSALLAWEKGDVEKINTFSQYRYGKTLDEELV